MPRCSTFFVNVLGASTSCNFDSFGRSPSLHTTPRCFKAAGKRIAILVTLLGLLIVNTPCDVHAAWYLFTVKGPGNTPVAQVAEQIVPAQFNVNGGAALGLDYIYRVRNVSAQAIQGFSVYTGPAGGALLLTYTGTPAVTNPCFLQQFGPM